MTPLAARGPAFLFCPADRPDRFAKAAAAADIVIVDLEDAVTPSHREEARRNLLSYPLDPATTIIRVNPVTSADHARDIALATTAGFETIMLAKTSSAEEVESLRGFDVVALCETPEGITALEEIAACSNAVGLMWGSEDLVSALGGYSSRHADGSFLDVARYARARTLIAARTHHLIALDTVRLDFSNLEALRVEATDAAAMGFTGTACIHPTQVAVVRDAYTPSVEQLKWATEILDAAADREGVFRVGSLMVDGPVLAQARHIVSRSPSAPL